MDIKDLSTWGLSQAIYEVIENGFTYDEETGEVYFTTDDLDALNEALDTKLNSICGYIKHAESKAEAFKERANEVLNNSKYYAKKAEKLKDFLKYYMDANGITNAKDVGDYRIGFRKSTSVNVSNEDEVFEYMNTHPEYKENCVKEEVKVSVVKAGIKDILNSGVEIPGVSLVENKNVTIK